MAGDDSTSSEFAAAYDEAAAEAVAALADLVPAFANLGRLTDQSAANHRDANASSIITGAVVYDGTWLPDGECVSVLPATPPSVPRRRLAAGFSDKENWILDHIEGFVWPNADTDRLRDAAHVWRTAADGLDGLDRPLPRRRRARCETQRSPEIPLAVAATDELASADPARSPASSPPSPASCEEYAAQVDARRDEIRALLARDPRRWSSRGSSSASPSA